MTKQIHLAAHFPGVNNTTVWSDPRSGSNIDFSGFVHLAKTAERGKMDFFFLAEGLRLREQRGKIHDLDVVGRPDTFTVLAALAAVTEKLGLGGTINATFNEPYELARQFAALDHLSGGRAAWNVVTSSDAFTGENFRRGGYLDHAARYDRAAETVQTARELWDTGVGEFSHQGRQFDIHGEFNTPTPPQGHPVVIQAGDSDSGREFGAATADAIFSAHGTLAAGQAFYRDVKGRLAKYGRTPDQLKILPGATFVLGDTDEEARENARQIRLRQVGPQTAIAFAEQLWNRDLSAYDPEGPLPDLEPADDAVSISQGRARTHRDRLTSVERWRQIAAEKGLNLRQTVIEVTGRQSFVGTPRKVAEEINAYVQRDAADGFILIPHLTPTGLDEFVDKVIPELQERGVFRGDYTGNTLRDHLDLAPVGQDDRRSGVISA
ncbi:LLM class flavin-dependent oxidoreductase [Fodinicola acaciae]|uniref:LLM class flavin-dependent oxidoreductase n=1 Tax=Fodinicola acaciae TaxID=2681555 RepID=UPI0013D52986|nr:LLM class flavin-dependent oxidoreductase [Fodinicola acaciae]